MSVIGIDFGNESCYIAVARSGGIETIANDYSLRGTPSCVAFTERSRIMGVAAANQRVTNMKNTIVDFKRLLGRKFNDPAVQRELKYLPYTVVGQSDGSIGIKVRYLNEEQVFSPEQITAMLFSKLKDTAEAALKIKVSDCVISVPFFYTQAERKALLDAAYIAGLNVLRLFNDTTSLAFAYGIYKQDLPDKEETPRNVVFVDCGHSSLQVSAAAFNKGVLKMLAAASDANLGGRDFDRLIAEHIGKDILARYKCDANKNPRAYLRLTTEVEKLKKQMSANSTKLPINIECFMEDKDVSSSMQRQDMEEMCGHLFDRVANTLTKCLVDSKLSLDEIYAVEIVGGSTRIPAIKTLIEQIFKKQPSSTLNQDEAVARGCALQCAALSPAFKLRDISVTDILNYPMLVRWAGVSGKTEELEMFSANNSTPVTRQMTILQNKPFSVEVLYNAPTPHPDPCIGKFFIQDVKPVVEKVRVKFRINLHGMLTMTSAQALEPVTAEQEKLEKENATDENKMETENADQAPVENGDSGETDENKEEMMDSIPADGKKEKRKVRPFECAIKSETQYGLPGQVLQNCFEAEGKMEANDRQEKERVDAKNSLEEYVYDLRSKLQDDSQLSRYVPKEDLNKLDSLLNDMVNWLYEDGEDCQRNIYTNKLEDLRKLGEPIKNRKVEAEVRPKVLEDLARSIQQSYKIIDQYRNNDEKYAHIPAADIDNALKETQRVEKWMDEQRLAVQRAQLYENPPVTVAEIRQQKQTFENIVAPIFNKPKPKVEPPPAEPQAPNAQNGEQTQQSTGANEPNPDKMDVE